MRDLTATHRNHMLACALLGACLIFSGCSPAAKEARDLKAGKHAMEAKDYARAVIYFRNAAQAMPKDAEPYYQLALAQMARREWKPAYTNLKKAVELNPKHQEAQLKLAELKMSTNDKVQIGEAQKTVQDLVNGGQGNAEALDILAATEWKLGDQEDAEKHLEEAVAKFPAHLASAVTLAGLKARNHDLAGAEEILKKSASQTPPTADAFLALGQFYMKTGRMADAEAQLHRALQVDPKSAPALLTLAVVQIRNRKLDDAERSYAQLAALPDQQYKPYHASFLSARGKHDQAIAEFEKLNRQYPDDRVLRTNLVQEYLRTQKIAAAETLITSVLKKNPKDVDALVQRSSIYLLTGRLDDAQKDLTQALSSNANAPEAHYLMAKVDERRGQPLNARQELSEALRLRPGYLLARLRLCQLLITSGSPRLALDLIDAQEVPPAQKRTLGMLVQRNWALLALGLNADARKGVDLGLAATKAPDILIQDAYLKLVEKNYDGARASLKQAITQRPEDLRILRMMVSSYAAQKQPAAAVRFMQEYAGQHPKSAPVQLFLADVLLGNGQRPQARAALLAAKAADPKYAAADLTLAQLDVAEGHVQEATKALSALVAQNPAYVPARLLLAGIEDKSGDRKGAVEAYKKVVESQPNNVVALNNLAFDLVEYSKQPDAALPYAQKAAELQPDAPAVENTLGWILYQKGMYPEALPYLEKAAAKEPTARHKCHLAMAYLKNHDRERGQKSLMEAVKLDQNLPEIKDAQRVLDDELQSGR